MFNKPEKREAVRILLSNQFLAISNEAQIKGKSKDKSLYFL